MKCGDPMHKKLWNKDYILLLQANVISSIGDLMYSVAIGYWVYEKTGSSALMGIMSAISMFVSMFLSPFSGSIVDKCDRKKVIVGVDAIQGLLMLTVGVFAYMNALDVVGVLLVALVAAFGSVFYSPAVSTLMLDIIPHDDMVRGQSIHSSATALISMVGSAFSGVMVAFFGVPLIVVMNGLSNLYSAVSELFIHVPRTVQQGQPVTAKGVLRDMGDAIKSIFADKCLKIFVPCALILNLLGAGPGALMLPFCLEKGFTVDMYGYGSAIVTFAYLLGVVVLGTVKLSPKVRFWAMGIGFVSSVVLSLMAYLSEAYILILVLYFGFSLCNCIGNTIFNASLMLAMPEENRGAILGFIQAACTGGSALSAVIYGLLGDVFPLYLVFAAGAILSLVPMVWLCFHRDVKEFVLNH